MRKTLTKLLKRTIVGVLLLLFSIVIIGVLFMWLSPQFGGKPSENDIAKYSLSDNYKEGKFQNLVKTSMDMGFSDMMSVLGDYIKGVPNQKPKIELPIVKHNASDISQVAENVETSLIWFGHSAFLLQMEEVNILIDPMLSEVPAPHPWLGRSRYSKELPIEVDSLPSVDVLLISHDHYDHLDYESIKKLSEKTEKFLVPYGVAPHLRKWGVASEKITEFDWWQSKEIGKITFTFTPSRHFSGRGLMDRFTTLWGSWAIKSDSTNIYFSGDSGYEKHFAEIGQKLGPFDFAMLECGQYNEKWANIHMMPEETAQAAIDLNAANFMPIHWAAFTLALHSWTDPVERVTAEAKRLSIPITVPKIGEKIIVSKNMNTGYNNWWMGL